MKFLFAGLIFALLLESVSALLPSRLLPHDHILLGAVTADALRAHLAAEEAEMQDSGQSASSLIQTTATGGEIVSILPGTGPVTLVHLDLAVPLSISLVIALFFWSLAISTLPEIALAFPSPDPPPRSDLLSPSF